MEETVVGYGSRVKFIKKDNMLISHKIYTDGVTQIRIYINTEDMTYKLQDPVTGEVYAENERKYTNLEVVQRNAKRVLKEILDINFKKEARKVDTNG